MASKKDEYLNGKTTAYGSKTSTYGSKSAGTAAKTASTAVSKPVTTAATASTYGSKSAGTAAKTAGTAVSKPVTGTVSRTTTATPVKTATATPVKTVTAAPVKTTATPVKTATATSTGSGTVKPVTYSAASAQYGAKPDTVRDTNISGLVTINKGAGAAQTPAQDTAASQWSDANKVQPVNGLPAIGSGNSGSTGTPSIGWTVRDTGGAGSDQWSDANKVQPVMGLPTIGGGNTAGNGTPSISWSVQERQATPAYYEDGAGAYYDNGAAGQQSQGAQNLLAAAREMAADMPGGYDTTVNDIGAYSGKVQPFDYDQAAPAWNGYGAAPEYEDRYGAQRDAALDAILNREAFSYDPETDPLYQTYARLYQQEGDRAMRNTLGQVSARTGGLANSWAASAAQQANNYYASKTAEKYPELYQLARQMYQEDLANQRQDYNLLANRSSEDYSRYRDTVNDWQNNRAFDYGAYRDRYGDWENDRSFAYNKYRDDLADDSYAQQFAYQQQRDRLGDAYRNLNTAYGMQRDSIEDEKWKKTFDRGVLESDRDYGLKKSAQEYSQMADTRDYNEDVRRWDQNRADERSDTAFTQGMQTRVQDYNELSGNRNYALEQAAQEMARDELDWRKQTDQRDFNEGVREFDLNRGDKLTQNAFDNGETARMNDASIQHIQNSDALATREQDYKELTGDRNYTLEQAAQALAEQDARHGWAADDDASAYRWASLDADNQQSAYNRQSAIQADARNQINDYLSLPGARAADLDPDLVAASGYSSTELAVREAAYQEQYAGGAGAAGGYSDEAVSALYKDAANSVNPAAYIEAHAGEYGLSDISASALKSGFTSWDKAQNAPVNRGDSYAKMRDHATALLNGTDPSTKGKDRNERILAVYDYLDVRNVNPLNSERLTGAGLLDILTECGLNPGIDWISKLNGETTSQLAATGRGPISNDELQRMIDAGEIAVYLQDGQIKLWKR